MEEEQTTPKITISFSDLRHTEDTCKLIPFGIALVASNALRIFKDKIDVDLFKNPNEFIKHLETNIPKIVCFSNYIWNSNLSYEFAKRIKEKSPNTIVIFGGPNYPLDAEEQESFLISHPYVDFYLQKEGEQAFVELLKKLFEYNFDTTQIKQHQVNIPNTHYLNNGKIVLGELLPRITDLNEIPSPYLTGLCDKFLSQNLIPLIQTTRGCPFTCTYCQEGNSYFSKIPRFSSERIKQEIEYIAQRTTTPTLELADSNFGMYEEDIKICKDIAEIQKKYNWPKFFLGIDGKNCKSRILEAASIVKGSLLMAPVQSTSKEVLKNIKRQGISIDQMVEIVKESEKIGSSSFSEVILCLPGDTKNTHFNSILDLINSEIDIVRSHQLIMLPGSEAATRKNREEYGLITRFRVTPGTSESYNLFEETFAAPEIDEICVASNSMSFNDYLECRLFNLTVEIFYNYNIFQGLLKFLKIYKINLASFILAVHEQIKKSEHLSKLYDNFLTETKEVWETREKLSGFLKQPGVIERYQSKELGNNEQLLYRALATLNHMDSIHEITANVAKDLLIKEGYSNEQILNYLKELTEFSLSRKKDLLAIENTSEKTFHYDFINLLANNFNDNPLTYYKPEGIAVSFSYSNEQKEFISKHLEIYGQSKNGLSFILSAIFRSTNPYRRAQLLNPPEKEEVNKNSKNIDKIEETENYLKTMASKFEVSQIQELLDRLNPLSVLVIGDTILDHYVFVKPKGRAIKDPILSVEYKNREIYAGGILAIANHLSDFVSKIKLVTLVGDHDSYQDTIIQSLRKNIELKSFIKVNSPTTMKKRMIDNYRNNKLFKIEYINDRPINLQLTQEVLDFLEEEVPKHDLVIVGDFGHGFINDVIRRKLEEKSKFLAVNAQSNSANMGFNYINLYRQQDFISMDEQEIRLPLSMRFEEIDAVLKAAHQKFQYPNFMVTQGKKGCLFVNQGNTYSSPGIITSVKDTVGAGDALFAISSLVVYLQAHPELVPFIGNCAGGIAANIMGNKEPVTKEKILSFINEVYQNEMGRIQKSD